MCIFASFICVAWLIARCVRTFILCQDEGWFPFWSTILYSKLNEKFSHDDERSRAAPAFSVITIQDFSITIIIIFGQHRSKQTFVSSSSSRERHRRAWITVTSLRWLTCVYLFPLVLASLAGSTRWSHVSKTESFFSRYFLFISRSTLSTCQ